MTMTTQRRRIFVFSHPRTCSHLLIRHLEAHPALSYTKYPFLYAFRLGPERLVMNKVSDNMATVIDHLREIHANTTFQFSLDELERSIYAMEAQGKIPLIKDHSYHMMDSPTLHAYIDNNKCEIRPKPTIVDHLFDLHEAAREKLPATPSLPIPNPLIISNRLFATFTPILTIRHPCRTIPSFRRVTQALVGEFPDDDTVIDTQLKWQRMVYECYRAWFSTPEGIEAAGGPSVAEQLPIIIDGDKLIDDPQGQMERLCRILNLDSSGIQYTWQVQPIEDVGQALFNTTVRNSTGVIKGKDGSNKVPILEEEVKKWTKEWDEKSAGVMKSLAERMMKDYVYLLESSI